MTRQEARAVGEKKYRGRPCPHGHSGDRWTTTGGCVDCVRKSAAALARRRPWASRRVAQLRTNYGISVFDFDALWAEQGGGCRVCGLSLFAGSAGHAIDHCHTTGAVRGLLCPRCNLGLGLFADDPTRLRAAASYLEQHRTANSASQETPHG